MLKAALSGSFRKEAKLAKRRGWDVSKLDRIMEMLVKEQPLPPERLDHPLHGNFSKYRECHVQGDWVLIYQAYPADGKIVFERTGTHSDLFKS